MKFVGGVEVQLYSFFIFSSIWECVVNAKIRPLYPGQKHPLHILQEAERIAEPVLTDIKTFDPTGIGSPDLPARSESLYRLRYPGPRRYFCTLYIAFVRYKFIPSIQAYSNFSTLFQYYLAMTTTYTAWKQTPCMYSLWEGVNVCVTGHSNYLRFFVGYSESKCRLRISLAHPRDCHFAHVQWLSLTIEKPQTPFREIHIMFMFVPVR